MIYLELFLTFLQVGVFCFGGGYAMIPLITKSVADHAWMTQSEIADIIAISQMAPGPIYLNVATFVGAHQAGAPGSAAAILGVLFPSFVIILILAKFFYKLQHKAGIQHVLMGIRPAIIGLISAATLTMFAQAALAGVGLASILSGTAMLFYSIDYISIVIIAGTLVGLLRFKLHPLLLLGLSALAGIAIYFIKAVA